MDEKFLQQQNDEMEKTFTIIKEYILKDIQPFGLSAESCEKLLVYNCKGGKIMRGKLVPRLVHCYVVDPGWQKTHDSLSHPKDDPEFLARVVGWCIEMLQGHFLVLDDIMDSSELRRFHPCWYKLPEIGTAIAINDGNILRSWMFLVLKHYFCKQPYYSELIDLFLHVAYLTEIGQSLDLIGEKTQKRFGDFGHFSESHYFNTVHHKTCYYTFYLPIMASLLIARVSDIPVDTIMDLAFLFGEYFQIKDDMMDCYSNAEEIGKIGTDIQDFKCSWLAVQFRERASTLQLSEFEKNYGKADCHCIQRIKELYNEVRMQEVFEKCEEDYASKVNSTINSIVHFPLQTCLRYLWSQVYKRKK